MTDGSCRLGLLAQRCWLRVAELQPFSPRTHLGTATKVWGGLEKEHLQRGASLGWRQKQLPGIETKHRPAGSLVPWRDISTSFHSLLTNHQLLNLGEASGLL